MYKLNKLGVLCVVMALFVCGCGKKKCHTNDKNVTTKSKKVASANIPLIKEETENLLEDGDISDFAFIDDEATNDKAKTVEADTNKLVAEGDEVATEESIGEEADTSPYAFKTVHFDFNKNSIRNDQKNIVAQNTEVAQKAVAQGKKVVIEGHCDQIGSASYNLALSQRRAETIKSEIIKTGVASENIKTVGYGYERPLVWSDQKNRAQLIVELAPNRRTEALVN